MVILQEDKQEGGDLTIISSGQLAPTNIQSDLLQAHQIGCTAFESFRKERLETQEKNFYVPLKNQKPKTFTDANQGKGNIQCW